MVGISTACFFMREDTEKAIVEISRLGIKNCEIFLSGYSEYTEEFFHTVESILDGEGMSCSAVHALSLQFEPQLFSGHKRQREDALGIFNRILDGAGRFKAKCYVLHGHFMLKSTDHRPNYKRAGGHLAELSSMASQRGVTLTLENVHYCMYNRCGMAKNLEQYIDGSTLGYTLDIKQAVRAGEDPFDYLNEMGGRLANLHVCGVEQLKTETHTCMPEYSAVSNDTMAARLKDINYNGPVTLEVYPGDYMEYSQLRDSILYMESVYG